MSKFWLSALQTIVKVIVGSLNFERIRDLVLNAESSVLSGEQKRAAVIREARALGIDIGTALINLAIETAVSTLRK